MGTLRLTGGTLRSRSVRTPSGRAVRPTPARVKEALFSILADRLDNAERSRPLRRHRRTWFRGALARRRACDVRRAAPARPPTPCAERRKPSASPTARRFSRFDRARGAHGRRPLRSRLRRSAVRTAYPAATFATLRERGAIDERSLVVYEHSSRLRRAVRPGVCRAAGSRIWRSGARLSATGARMNGKAHVHRARSIQVRSIRSRSAIST